MNDAPSTKANCQMKKKIAAGQVHLCLFAKKDIPAGTELRYDYGFSDLPWRKTGKTSKHTNQELLKLHHCKKPGQKGSGRVLTCVITSL